MIKTSLEQLIIIHRLGLRYSKNQYISEADIVGWHSTGNSGMVSIKKSLQFYGNVDRETEEVDKNILKLCDTYLYNYRKFRACDKTFVLVICFCLYPAYVPNPFSLSGQPLLSMARQLNR